MLCLARLIGLVEEVLGDELASRDVLIWVRTGGADGLLGGRGLLPLLWEIEGGMVDMGVSLIGVYIWRHEGAKVKSSVLRWMESRIVS